MRPGGYTQGARQGAVEDQTAQKRYDQAKRVTKKLKREAARRRNLASQADGKLSKRGLSTRDHDARDKIDRARLSGKDGVDGKRLRQVESRLKQAQKKKDLIKVKKTYETGIWLEGSRSRRDTLFNIPEGVIAVGARRSLRFPPLTMRPDDRVALTGSNGTGKSTLIRHVVSSLNLPADRVTYLPQEIGLGQSQEILNECRGLPNDVLGHMMTVVSRLGSRPRRLLESAEPSPGEIRKLLVAMGIARAAHLIIMDEPTNHLDLPSIECLEEALGGCPGGLLLVSHDKRFLDSLARRTWQITRRANSEYEFELLEP
jgi:ATPase subunit of ABC transporter with duplicated ATPase domains